MRKSFRKYFRLSVAVTFVLFVGVLGAQTQKEQTPVRKEAGAAPMSTSEPSALPRGQPSSPDAIHLRAGQQIGFLLKTRLSSEHAKAGDVVDSLAIAFRDIRTVNGDIVQLAGKEERSGADKKDEIAANIGGAIVQTLGAGAVFAPLFLLQRGETVQLDPGTRLSAFVGRDLTLERALIEMHQPVPSTELATVYVFHGWHPTCGSIELPFDELQKGLVKLELPPGNYWFHTGAYMGVVRGIFAGTVAGLTWGAATPSEISPMKKVLSRPTSEFTALDAKGGHTYYLIRADNDHSAVKQELKLMDAAEGEKLLAGADAPYYILRDISPDMLDQLQARPLGKNSEP
jgi:hypothetical protein